MGNFVGEKIITLRKDRGITRSELARAIGVSRSTLLNIEDGISKNPSWYTVCKIADYFNVKVEDLR